MFTSKCSGVTTNFGPPRKLFVKGPPLSVKIFIRREAAPLLKTSINVGLYLDPGASIPPKVQDATPPIQFIPPPPPRRTLYCFLPIALPSFPSLSMRYSQEWCQSFGSRVVTKFASGASEKTIDPTHFKPTWGHFGQNYFTFFCIKRQRKIIMVNKHQEN